MAEKGGLLGQVLLPGFTDSGANMNFQAAIPQKEQQKEEEREEETPNMVTAVPSLNRLVFRPIISDQDAITEIADNRTSMPMVELPNNTNTCRRMDAAAATTLPTTTSTPIPTTPAASRDDGKIPHGFFPSTTPNRRHEHGSSSPRHPTLQHPPSPPSPPTVDRRKLPTSATNMNTNYSASSVAGTSVVPQIGTDQPFEAATTTASSGVLGYQFLKDHPTATSNTNSKDEQNNNDDARKSANTSTNDDDDDDDDQPSTTRQQQQQQQQQPQDENANDHSYDDSLSTSSHSNNSQEHHLRNSSLLEHDNNSPTNQSEVYSDINSNASEFGTVINVTGARLEEVEAMAALIEATPSSFDEQYPHQHQHAYGEADDDPSGLALPILESTSYSTRTSTTQNNQYRSEYRSEPPSGNILPAKHAPVSHYELNNMEGGNSNTSKGGPLVMDKGASAMVSAAIRRIGSGLHKKKATTQQESNSAPPTPGGTPGVPPPPPRVQDLLKLDDSTFTYTPLSPKRDYHTHPPPSFAFRSPGSAARGSLMPPSSSPRRMLTPRFSRPVKTRNEPPGQRVTLTPRTDNQTHHKPQPSQPSQAQAQSSALHGSSIFPFRFAQKCFSFDSTLDHHLDSDYPSDRHQKLSVRQTPRQTDAYPGIEHTQSWDIGSVSNQQRQRQPFRPNVRTMPVDYDPVTRARLHSDFSPTKASQQHSIELQTPQRIEIEREDALDILACLVERGVSMDKASNAPKPPSLDEQEIAEQFDSTVQIQSVVEELKRMSSQEQHQIGGQAHTDHNHSHNQRMSALDELLRSHAYALEMKRAAMSASTWLKSIGRSQGGTDDPSSAVCYPESNSSGGQASAEQGESSTASEKIELMTLKARLHTAQMQAKEKTKAAQKMDLELSKCRAEIGRLRSSSSRAENHMMPMTPNRSILDDSQDTEVVSPAADVAKSIDRNNNNPSPIEMEGSRSGAELSTEMNDSLFRGLSEAESKDALKEQADHLDVLVMRTALDQANAQIRHLHHALMEGAPESGPPPIVDIPDLFKGQDSPPNENRMVNVRMLDGENFVTEWDNLTPPLPPPPDHGLRSPIVGAVLEQWTSDRALHESLLAWIDRVMSGHDIDAVPPLTISSLNHQVRDGFTMHVLPLLLRRADIHMTVQTRAHRRTTYDLAVTVNRKSQHIAYTESRGMMDGEVHDPRFDDWSNRLGPGNDRQSSVAHSAVTAHITNAARQSPTNYGDHTTDDATAMANYAEGNFGGGLARSASLDMSEALQLQQQQQQQQGLMTALGGALGGLLSRRKCSVSSPSRFHDTGSGMPAALRAQLDLTSSPVPSSSFRGEEDEQPYHRVVSAPPGRIGITFVEFRGHAMVSDVSPSSPLLDWVFPSDILIAIDEVPVSGMRVRDIIKVLTNRKDRQRALRVISSHAMNEFTLNASHMNDTS